jgi:tRNA-2-methylthio-N6-dimethylallyladenosine synthase
MDTLQEVLVEGTSESNENMLTGRTPHNRLVNFPIISPKSDLEGMLALVKITDAKTFSLEGEFIKWVE